MKDIRLLKPEEIEVRIQSANKGGVRLLLFKNARCDMSILDETFGAGDGFLWQAIDQYASFGGWLSENECYGNPVTDGQTNR